MKNSSLATLLSCGLLLSIYITTTMASSDSSGSDSNDGNDGSEDDIDACDACVERGCVIGSFENCTTVCAGRPLWQLQTFVSIDTSQEDFDIDGQAKCLGNYCCLLSGFDYDRCLRGDGPCAVWSDRDISEAFSDSMNFEERLNEIITLFGSDGLTLIPAVQFLDNNDDTEWTTMSANACQLCIIHGITGQLPNGCDPIELWCSGVNDFIGLQIIVEDGNDIFRYSSEGACFGADCCTFVRSQANDGNISETVLCGESSQTLATGVDDWFGVLDKHEIQFPHVSDGGMMFAAAKRPVSMKTGAVGVNSENLHGVKEGGSLQQLRNRFVQKMIDMHTKHEQEGKDKQDDKKHEFEKQELKLFKF